MSTGNSLFFPAAIWIDNVQLTDQGRETIVRARDERSTVNELSSGTRKKYVKAVKHTFSTAWKFLPDSDEYTIDGYAGRSTMLNLFGDSGESHLLRFHHRNGEFEDFRVFVQSYEETLIRRDPASGLFLWDVSVEFEES